MTNERRRKTSAAGVNGTGARTAGTTGEPSIAAAQEPLAFEEAFGKLDEAVNLLEDGQLPLEDALTIYEESMRLAQRCQELLDAAELRVERLRRSEDETAGEAFALDPFDVDDEES